MKLQIAGFNIDKCLIDSLNNPTATPEVISAAYARISRSLKNIDDLRKDALREIDKARISNTNIIFEMGHSSVAEHAVFNLDLIGISRALTDVVQRSRIASFTEKSQRYVTFGKDYIVPDEFSNRPKLKKPYKELMNELFAEYEASFTELCAHYEKCSPKLKPREREALAKEDARYILPLSTKTQMGITMNARSIENLLRRLAKCPLLEAAELKNLLYTEVAKIAPSLIRYTDNDGYIGQIDLEKVGFSGFLQQELPWVQELDLQQKVKILGKDNEADDHILTALIYQQGELGWKETRDTVNRLPRILKQQLWNQVFFKLKPWHKLPRAFEVADFQFELNMSESCWAQFKRHRYCTLLRKGGYSNLGKIPESILIIKRHKIWQELQNKANQLQAALPIHLRQLSPYFRLNASTMTVFAKLNLREIYHFIRLRSDIHAQWEIRELSDLMAAQIRKVAPNAANLLCGKSDFPQGPAS